jgi:hypothetical protein
MDANGKGKGGSWQKMRKATTCRFDSVIQNQDGSISIRKAARIDDRGKSKGKTPTKRKKRLVPRIPMKSEVEDGRVVIDLPIQTVSEANCFESWQKKHGRHKDQQRVVALGLKPLRDKIKLPCRIMLTRFAPDELDAFDNLPMSFKYIVDAVCAIITGEYRAGKADSDKRISIACGQVKSSEYGIRIEVTY